MKIKRLFLSHLTIPLKASFVTAQLHRSVSCNIILRIEFDNGLWGYGESTPRTYVTGESPKTVFEMIGQTFLPSLKEVDIEQLADVEVLVAKLNKHLDGDIFHGSALCAVELALLDGLGKLLGKPLQHVLGKQLREKIGYSLGLPYMDVEKLPSYFKTISKYQPPNFKIKLGKSPSQDLERIAQVSSYFGDKFKLRVDVNCQWDISTAIMMAAKLEKLGVTAIEQPLAKNDIKGLIKLKKATSLKIIADESACSFNDIKRLIDEDACDYVIIKISKCGGLINSLKMAKYLFDNNKACILGAHAAETGILESAGRIFGVLAQSVRYFEGSISSFLFDQFVVEGTKGFDSLCLASPSPKPGLGVTFKRDLASKYTVKESLLFNKCNSSV